MIAATVGGCVGSLESVDPISDPGEAASDVDAGSGGGGDELLTVSFDSTANGGEYAPRNIVAIWIEEADGTFVKTIGRWAQVRRQHLVAWTTAAGQDTDAVSGATRPDHSARLTASWDLTSRQGQLVPDGAYTIRLELADENATTPAQNHQGTLSFDRNGQASTQTMDVGGFVGVTVEYTGR